VFVGNPAFSPRREPVFKLATRRLESLRYTT
jgi:hypothetical protein